MLLLLHWIVLGPSDTTPEIAFSFWSFANPRDIKAARSPSAHVSHSPMTIASSGDDIRTKNAPGPLPPATSVARRSSHVRQRGGVTVWTATNHFAIASMTF